MTLGSLPLLFSLVFLGSASLLSAEVNALPNPGFENGADEWAMSDGMSKVVAEAAEEGKLGLHIDDQSPTAGSSVMSARLPVKPDQEIKLTFSARTDQKIAGVYLWFYDASGHVIKDPAQRAGAGSPICGIDKIDGAWNRYSLTTKAPAEAETVAIWIHTFGSAMGAVDLDNFLLEGIAADAIAITPSAPASPKAPALAVSSAANPPPRTEPPVIIVKLDDLRQTNGAVDGAWNHVLDYLKSRNIKASVGIICETLAEATPEYIKWIKERQASGEVEFWFHGWDHAVWTDAAGKKSNEFMGRPYEEQKKRFDDSQKLAEEKLGFAFATFGPPGGTSTGSCDAVTAQVMDSDPSMKVWLYPQPIDPVGQQLQSHGKVAILDRVWPVNFESQVGTPNFQKFVDGYNQFPQRKYFVLQGHPTHWGNGPKWDEFVKIIDFLVAQKAVFMTPSEYAPLAPK